MKKGKKKPPGKGPNPTERVRLFVEAYTGEAKGNGTLAAKIAGYSGNEASLASQATRLLRNAKVRAAISEANLAVRSKAIASRREIQTYLTQTMRGELQDEELCVVGCGEGFSEVERHERRNHAKDRLKAAELLGKMQGLFIERLDVRVDDAFRAKLKALQSSMSKGAFEELLAALEGGGEEPA